MKYTKRSDFGELEINFEKINGAGSRKTVDFLRKLSENFVARCGKYFNEIEDHAFAYRERQLHSVICPSIADITDSFLMENPTIRKPAADEEYSGAVDYWIFYRNFSFLLELKHAFFAYTKAKHPRKIIVKRFQKALEQLENVKKPECKAQTFGDGMRKIALEVVVFYRGSKEKNELLKDVTRRDFLGIFNSLLKNTALKKISNVQALWTLDRKLVEPFEYENTYEIYPAVGFIANVSKLIK